MDSINAFFCGTSLVFALYSFRDGQKGWGIWCLFCALINAVTWAL